MKKALLWILAFLLTAFVLLYQRVTGPTYPKRVKMELAGETVSAELLRTHVITADCPVRLSVPSQDTVGYVRYKRFPTGDSWTRLDMRREGSDLLAQLPKQPMAGKLAYQVVLSSQGQETILPSDEPVVMRYKGEVPGPVLILHILVIFGALFFSFRAGFEAIRKDGNVRKLAIITAVFLFVGGIILGPLMQKYAFDAWWTGFPVGKDLTDTKTLFALLGWIIALIAGRSGRPARGWYLAAFALTLIVFLIPHSVLGSELDYSTLDQAINTAPTILPLN
jgi:hypothetical protein